MALRKEYHFTTTDLEEMDVDKYYFALFFLESQREEQKRLADEQKLKNNKNKRKFRK